jgi:hypothetical protein
LPSTRKHSVKEGTVPRMSQKCRSRFVRCGRAYR